MIQPRFLPNDIVFGIPDSNFGWGGLNWWGTYKISKVDIVPVGSDKTTFRYYAVAAGAFYIEIELMHVFADKKEFLEFMAAYEFGHKSPQK